MSRRYYAIIAIMCVIVIAKVPRRVAPGTPGPPKTVTYGFRFPCFFVDLSFQNCFFVRRPLLSENYVFLRKELWLSEVHTAAAFIFFLCAPLLLSHFCWCVLVTEKTPAVLQRTCPGAFVIPKWVQKGHPKHEKGVQNARQNYVQHNTYL